MEAPARTPQVRLTLRSASAMVAALAATVVLLDAALSAKRVLAWVLSAAAVAALVYPLVTFFDRFLPRAVAVLLVVVVVLGSIGLAVYALVDDVQRETRRLQQVAPERAAEMERESEFLRELEFRQRVERLVDAIPERLRGGTTAEAIRSAANRGLAFLASVILTLFFVAYGARIVDGFVAQFREPRRRALVEQVVRQGGHRALGYARGTLLEAIVEGLIAWAVAGLAGVPGPAALGVWAGLWSIVPVAGVVIGSLPVVALAAADSPARAWACAAVFVATALVEWLVVKPRLERATLQVGSFLTVLAAFGGIELYGLSGALLAVLGAALVVAVVGELDAAGEIDIPDAIATLSP